MKARDKFSSLFNEETKAEAKRNATKLRELGFKVMSSGQSAVVVKLSEIDVRIVYNKDVEKFIKQYS